MPEHLHPDLRVVRFDDESIDPARLGSDLHDIISRNPDLVTDFPSLPDLYSSPAAAEAIVVQRRAAMAESMGNYAVYAVQYGERAIGVATAEQDRLRARGRAFLKTTRAEGPWIAYWLDDERPADQRHVGVPMLRAVAADIIDDGVMSGSAFTVVRDANVRSRRILEDTDNGFGGFATASDRPQRYPVGDGVSEPRWLYIARQSLEALRA
jgi:hypothetical protein